MSAHNKRSQIKREGRGELDFSLELLRTNEPMNQQTYRLKSDHVLDQQCNGEKKKTAGMQCTESTKYKVTRSLKPDQNVNVNDFCSNMFIRASQRDKMYTFTWCFFFLHRFAFFLEFVYSMTATTCCILCSSHTFHRTNFTVLLFPFKSLDLFIALGC